MKQFLPASGLIPRFLVLGWVFTAVFTWGATIASLPGYYLWYVEHPMRMQFNLQQMILTSVIGLASFFSALISLCLGTFLFLRKPGDRAALFVSFFLLIYGFIMSGPLEMGEYILFHQSGEISYRVQGVIFTPLTILLLLTFPNGRFTSSWVRWLIPPLILLSLMTYRMSGDEMISLATANSILVYSFSFILFLFAFASQVYRYVRKSSASERQQTKIVVYGIGIQFLLFMISSVNFLQLSTAAQKSLIPEGLLLNLFWWAAIAILPIALTLAVLRSHLWDIDVVIRRTLVYGFLTATLALIYFGGVVLFQYLFRLMAGHESPLAVVISTLAIAGLFQPLRGRIQAAIDRRFYRSKYNSEQALAGFQKSMRERVDMGEVERELTGIVQVTVQPEWTMVWMRKPSKE